MVVCAHVADDAIDAHAGIGFVDRYDFDISVGAENMTLRTAAILATPSCAQASSLSPPGAPPTPSPATISLPRLIATPPGSAIISGRLKSAELAPRCAKEFGGRVAPKNKRRVLHSRRPPAAVSASRGAAGARALPAVGVVRAERQQITETDEFIGRIQAVNRVALVARVTGFLEKRLFTEGAEVKKGDLLYQIEKPPFQAVVDAAQATVEQMEAQHRNAQLTLQRAQTLLSTPAGQQSNVDAALASERALAAQISGAQAQLETAQINLGYTEIRAPIDGKITSTSVTEGNVVLPTSGTLATIVSQDPMYVLFSISLRAGLDLRARYAAKGGYSAVVIKLRLPDGRIYDKDGRLDYGSPTVTENTDTIVAARIDS